MPVSMHGRSRDSFLCIFPSLGNFKILVLSVLLGEIMHKHIL